jgi:tetratricopeptide (TPR) repeat protein
MGGRSRRTIVAVAIAGCLALALGGQAVADSLVPGATGEETGRAVGQATLSYASGLRRYAGDLLWARMEPLLHNYYDDVVLEDQLYVLSTVALVEWFDPELIEPYYVGAWILAENDVVDEGIALARRGVEANPGSGLLRMNLAQLLMLHGNDLPGAVEMAESALEEGIWWTDRMEQHNAYPILGAIFRAGGREDLDAFVQAELEWLDREYADELEDVEHDHDHDGHPDH